MKKAFLFVLLCVGFLVHGQNLVQNVEKTTVDFKIKNLGINVDGRFSKVVIESNFNASDLEHSFINATIDTKSIDTGNDTRDESLSEEEYFDMANYPNMTLKSTRITKAGASSFTMEADLTIKSTTKKVTLTLMISEDGNHLVIGSAFELDRRDYDVGGSSWVMSDAVKITVNYDATR